MPLGSGQKCRGLALRVERLFTIHEFQYRRYKFKSSFTSYNTDKSSRYVYERSSQNNAGALEI